MCGRKLTAQCVALAVSASAAVSFARGVELVCAPRASSSSALRAASSALCLHNNNQQQSTICLHADLPAQLLVRLGGSACRALITACMT